MKICSVCKGDGKVIEDCETCGGKGHSSVGLVNGENLLSWYACHDCGNRRCVRCGGDGLEPVPATKLRIV
jgi:hypothetical protein